MDWITLDTFQWPVCESLLHMGRHLSISNLGSLLLIVPDDFDFASMSVAKAAVGARARQGSSLILEARHTILRSNQCTSCRMGLGPSIMLYPPVEDHTLSLHHTPCKWIWSRQMDQLSQYLQAPFHHEDGAISTYRIDFSTEPFAQEKRYSIHHYNRGRCERSPSVSLRAPPTTTSPTMQKRG